MPSNLYTTGTVSVSAGGTTFAGTGTAWASALIQPGDEIHVEGEAAIAIVQSVDGEGQITPELPWAGGTVADGAYAIFRTSFKYSDAGQVSQFALDMLAQIRKASVIYVVSGSAPDPSLGEENQFAVKTSTTPWLWWVRTGSAWVETASPFPVQVKGAYSGITTYATGDLVTYDGSVWRSVQDDNAGHTPDASPSWWELFISKGNSGDDGSDGNDGWSPVLASAADSARRVLQVVDWQGGEGTKPATGKYIGATGLVDLIGDGADVRGPAGAGGDASTASAEFRFTGVLSPAQITADQNDYAPAGHADNSVFLLSSDASRAITGLAGGTVGRTVYVHNSGSHDIVLKDESAPESASSTAANRFALTADLTLAPDVVAILQYDGSSSRWRAVSGGGGSALLYTPQSLSNAEKNQALANLGMPPSSLPLGFRNRWINGGMAVDQRNAGAAQTIIAGAELAYTVDRCYAYCTGGNVSGQRVAGSGQSRFRYRFTGAAGVTKIGFGQRIEAANIAHLAGQTVTLSVDLANSLLTSVAWTVWRGNAVDTFGTLGSPNRTQIATGTWTVTGTEARYSAQVSLPAEAANGIEVEFSVGAQTGGDWHIGRVEVAAGDRPMPFEVPLIGTEIGNCHRYYRRFRAPVVNASIVVTQCYSTLAALGAWPFSPSMRVPPTLGYSAVGDWALINPGASGAIPLTALSLGGTTTESTRLDCTVAAGLGGAGAAALFQAANTNAWLEFDAEMRS